jgi:hypothetical protein
MDYEIKKELLDLLINSQLIRLQESREKSKYLLF